MIVTLIRGQVWWFDVGGTRGRRPFVIVSNNERNRRLNNVLGVMVTTTDKSGIPTAVPMTHEDPVEGFALADNIEELWKDEVKGSCAGSLVAQTLMRLNVALKIALGIPT
jgi:mRNA interferase MazF